MTQLTFDIPHVAPRGIAWTRHPSGMGTCGTHHAMTLDGKPTGYWVKHCGHPTALRPYYVETDGRIIAQKFRLLADAKTAALADRQRRRS